VTAETMGRVAMMRRKVTSRLLLAGATAGTSGWPLLRDGAEQLAAASPIIEPVQPATPREPASFIRLNPARPGAAPAASAAAVATPHGPAAARPAAAPAAGPAFHAPAQAAPSNDDIHLKGIIRGTPDVALVCCEGQTYFVKAGERVAGAWEVREIKDNSAVLRNGGRVLELQIEGGS
jgi:hypothetical protein